LLCQAGIERRCFVALKSQRACALVGSALGLGELGVVVPVIGAHRKAEVIRLWSGW
jgi:hypothetical protein